MQNTQRLSIEIDQNFIKEYTKFVQAIVRKYTGRIPKHIDREDIFQAGMLGLFSAVKNYDKSRKVKFSVYAFHKIRGHVLDYLELYRLVRVPRKLRDEKIKPKKVLELFDNQKDHGSVPASHRLEREEKKNKLLLAINDLPIREKKIIVLYYYENIKLREVAKIMELTEGRVSQLKSLAIQKMNNSRHLKQICSKS